MREQVEKDKLLFARCLGRMVSIPLTSEISGLTEGEFIVAGGYLRDEFVNGVKFELYRFYANPKKPLGLVVQTINRVLRPRTSPFVREDFPLVFEISLQEEQDELAVRNYLRNRLLDVRIENGESLQLRRPGHDRIVNPLAPAPQPQSRLARAFRSLFHRKRAPRPSRKELERIWLERYARRQLGYDWRNLSDRDLLGIEPRPLAKQPAWEIEQIKLTATYLNGGAIFLVGTGAMGSVIKVLSDPSWAPSTLAYILVVVWFLTSFALHLLARRILRGILS